MREIRILRPFWRGDVPFVPDEPVPDLEENGVAEDEVQVWVNKGWVAYVDEAPEGDAYRPPYESEVAPEERDGGGTEPRASEPEGGE